MPVRPVSVPTQQRTARTWVASLVPPLAIYAVGRLVSALYMLAAAPAQPDLTGHPGWHTEGQMPAHPSYWVLATNWDGQWYRSIAEHGYPSDAVAGEQNPFAFSPLYPMLVRVLMGVTGGSFEVVAPLFSLLCGAVAVVLLYRWLCATRGRAVALAAVALLSTFPSAPALQLAYSDALAMGFLVVALRAAVERRWVVLCVFALLLSLARPIVFPLAIFTAVLARRPQSDEQGRRWDVRALAAAAFVALSTFAWPVTAGLLTGDLTTYFDSTGSWVRAGGLRGGWFAGMWKVGMPELAVAMGAIIIALAYLRWRRRSEQGPPDRIGLWASVYMLFVLATTTMSTSVFRHALLTLLPFGAFGPMALKAMSPKARFAMVAAIVLVQLALQWLWVRNVLVVDDSPDLSWPP